ncbi:MAG: PAS domain S-box protein [Fimbriimonas sp.]
MKRLFSPDAATEIQTLVDTLIQTEDRLEELTAGEIDTVADATGRTFYLRRAQDHLRDREAAKQSAIMDALPAHVCLLDQNGTIISVNQAWDSFAAANSECFTDCGVGTNYLQVCDNAKGPDSFGADRVAAGIRSVMRGDEPTFTMEYACDSQWEQRWFLLTVTPLVGVPATGVVIMHVNITDRKRSEVALHQMAQRTERKERLLNSALSSMSDFTQVYDREGRILFANQPLLNQWGRTLEEAVGKDFTELGYPVELAERLQRQINEVFETGKQIVDETPYTAPDGQEGFYEYIFEPILASDGSADLVVGTTRDVTERKRIAENLRTSEARMAVAQHVGSFGSWELDISKPDSMPTLTNWSDEMYRIYGLDPSGDVATGELFFSMVPEEEHEYVKLTVESAITHGQPFSFVHRIVRPDGQVRLLQQAAQVFHDERTKAPKNMVGTAHDITERKLAEEAYRDSEERFRLMLENVQMLAMILDVDGHVTFCNDFLLSLTDWKREEVIGCDWFALFVPRSDREERKEQFNSLGVTGLASQYESELCTKSGEVRRVDWNSAILKDSSGRVTGIACIGEDATARKSLQEQLLQSQKMESLGSLAGGIAHDFNNLLTGMLGYAELAQLRLPKDSPVQADLREITRSAERAAKLTQQLLSFARKEVVSPQVVDVSELVNGLANLLQRLLGSGIDLVLRSTPDLGRVQIDPSQMEQVLVNLAVNAKDAMAGGGALLITASNVEVEGVRQVRDGTLQPGEYVLISVTDTGCGMPKEVQARAFDPFFTTKEKGRGTGLGLSTCYGIISNSGGHILTSSEINFGTTFDIYLPRVAAPLTLLEATAAVFVQGKGETILLVEDEDTVRLLVSSILEGAGYKVLSATGGEDALRMIRSLADVIDVVITDVVMPGMTGPELAEILEAEFPGAKVLFMSGFTDMERLPEPTTTRPNAFLQKPFSPVQLSSKVREVLEYDGSGPSLQPLGSALAA